MKEDLFITALVFVSPLSSTLPSVSYFAHTSLYLSLCMPLLSSCLPLLYPDKSSLPPVGDSDGGERLYVWLRGVEQRLYNFPLAIFGPVP